MTQLTTTGGGEPVELGFAIVLGKSPLGVKQSLVFQTPEGWVECAFFEQKGVVALAANQVGDGVAV